MEAATLRCPGCGAPARTDLHACTHCGARLATVACPSCFGMVFRGTRHCPHCGAAAERAPQPDAAPLACPACSGELAALRVGATPVRECGQCGGVWMDNAAFEALCADREEQATVLAFRASVAAPAPAETSIRYRPCPECGALMHRLNFQRVSGVIVDVCRDHGTWFDADELRRIVEFIQSGGMEAARRREGVTADAELLRLEQAHRDWVQAAARADRETERTPVSESVMKLIARLL
jgi:Zn-finger nucleic acid-binding protein